MIESQNLVNITNKEDKIIIHELIKGKLWRISYIYIITSIGLDEIKKFTFKQFKIIGINYHIAYLWRKNDFKSKNLVIIPNKDIMNQIPTIHTEVRNRMHYMSEFEWDKIISFKNSFNTSNKVIFSRIIGKRSNIPCNTVRDWMSGGSIPCIYDEIDFDEFLRNTQNENPLIGIKKFASILGLLSSCGTFADDGFKWSAPIIDTIIAFKEELLPINRGTKLTISPKNRGIINSIKFKFIKFLERKANFMRENKKGKIFFEKKLINSFSREIKEIFVSQMIATHLSVIFNKTNKCIVLEIPCKSKKPFQIKMFIDLLEELNILPAVAYVGSNGKSIKEKGIISHFTRKNMNVVTHFSQNDLDISLFYPPYGRKNYSDFEYRNRAETTQRLIEDIVIKSYLSKKVVTNFIKYSNYLENIYGTHYPTKGTKKFKDAIDDIGGINTFDLTRMEESFKSYKGYEYCLPIWALE